MNHVYHKLPSHDGHGAKVESRPQLNLTFLTYPSIYLSHLFRLTSVSVTTMRRRNRVVDSSDESGSDDGGSGLDAPVNNAIADAQVEDSSDDTSDGDSDDSNSSPGDGRLDLEAEENSDGSSTEQSNGESNDSDSNPGNEFLDMEAMDSTNAPPSPIDSPPLESFPQFVRLPPELRQRVWELLCPDLESGVTRVVPVNIATTYPESISSPIWHFADVNVTLQDQTRLIRVVSAVHHESRALVVRRFPDRLPIRYDTVNDGYIRFNGDKDILALQFTKPLLIDGMPHDSSIPRNRKVKWVRRVAFDTSWFHQPFFDMKSVLAKFSQVETVFFWVHLADATFNVRWTASPYANRYHQQTSEEIDGFQHDLDFIFCWPDFTNHPDFAKYHIIPAFRDSVSKGELEFLDSKGVTFAPMVSFDLSSEVKEYDRLRRENEEGIPVDQGDGLTSVYDSELGSGPQSVDEYESEGIDDAEIEEYDESSEDEVIPGPIGLTDGSGSGDSGDDEGPEPAGGDEPVGGGPSRRRKRRIVSDSDDDDDDDEPVAKRVRFSNAASAAHGDDSDEHDEEGGAESNGSSGGSDESESSQPSASDDEGQPPVRLSLAERLRQFRDDNPVPSDEDSSDTAGHDEAGDEDDESEDDDEDDEDERGGGFIDDMAEDSEDEGDGSQESDGY